MTREYSWDNLKFFMMIGIVMEHALLIYDYPRQLELPWAIFISWLMPMFTLISGYFYKKRSMKDLCDRFLYPVLLFSSINFIVGYFFYPKYSSGIHMLGYSMWYLWALFGFSAIVQYIERYVSIKMVFILSLLGVLGYCVLPSLGKITVMINLLNLNRIIAFFPFFVFGRLLRQFDIRSSSLKKRILLPLLVVSLLVYVAICYVIPGLAHYSGFYLTPDMPLSGLLKFLFSYVIITIISTLIVMLVPNKEYKFSLLGSRTLNVYLLHMIVVFPISWGIFSHLSFDFMNVLLNILITCLICMFFYTAKVESIMRNILHEKYWGKLILLYLFSLVLVNKGFISSVIR